MMPSLLHESLGGGGTKSLKNDAQGKTLSSAMLRMVIDIKGKKKNHPRSTRRGTKKK
jgi:hypothetical protein